MYEEDEFPTIYTLEGDYDVSEYIKDKKDVYRLTKEEFESGNYEPCQACLPDEE